jgi:hypothetical protein
VLPIHPHGVKSKPNALVLLEPSTEPRSGLDAAPRINVRCLDMSLPTTRIRRLAAGALAVLAAAGAAVATLAQPRPQPTPFAPGFLLLSSRELPRERGATVRVFTLRREKGNRSPITLVIAAVPAHSARLEVREVRQEGPARTTYANGPCPTAIAAVNGSFFYHDADGYRPMGLVRIDGQTIQGPSPRTSGGFLASDGRSIRIVPRKAPAPALAARFAVESSPILIEGGKSGMRADDGLRFDRIGVGAADSGAMVVLGAFGVAQKAVSLWEFEGLARAAAARVDEHIADMLAMDGGPSAHLFLPDENGGVLYGQPGRIYTPNMVCVGLKPLPR